MPQAIGFYIADYFLLLEGTAEFAAVEIAVDVVVSVAISLAASAITQALAGKRSDNSGGANPAVTTRGTMQFRQLIYGEIKTGGFLAYIGTSGTNNGILWVVIVLAGHEIQSFSDLWLDSRHIPYADITPGTGAVTTAAFQGNGASRLSIGYSLGQSAGFYDTTLGAACPEWDSSHLGKGIPYLVFQMGHDDTAWPGGAPSSFFALVRGRKLYDPRLDSTNGGSGSQRYTDASTWTWSQNWALAVRDYLSGGAVVYASGTPDKRLALGEDDARIDDSSIIAAANHADETVTIQLPVLAGTTNWSHGSPTVTGNGTLFTGTLAAGNKLIGPDGVTYTIASTPPMTDTSLTLTANFGGTSVQNEITHYSTTGATSVTESRFTADCQLSCGTPHSDNLATLLSAGNGHLTFAQGKWHLFAGVYTTPTVTLTQDDILGALDVLPNDPMDQVWNYVDGTFFDEDNGWTQGPFPAQQNPAYETADGRQYPKSIDLLATRGNYRAQRLAQVILQQGRNQLTISASQVSQTAMQIAEWDTFYLTLPEYGWTNQVFRCISWKFLSSGYIAIQARSESSSAYADLPLTGYVDPSTNNPPAFVLSPPDPPQSFVATGVINGVQLTITPPTYFPSSQFLEIWEYSSSTPFSSATRVGTTRGTTFTVPHSDTVTRYYWVTTGDNNGGRSTSVPSGAGQACAPLSSQFWSPQLRGTSAVMGGTVFKTGSSNAWDSDVVSAIAYPSVSIEGTFSAGGASSIGLSTSVASVLQPLPGGPPGYFGIYAHADSSQTTAFDGAGNILWTGASPVAGDRYRITYDGFYVVMYVNGAAVAAAPLQGATVYPAIAMYHGGWEIFTNVQVSTSSIATPSDWTAQGYCLVSDSSALKQGGTNAWLGDSICSIQGHTVCHIAAKINSALNNNCCFGLTTNPGGFRASTYNPQSLIDCAWNASTPTAGASGWYALLNGTVVATVARAPAANDSAWIEYDGSTVYWYLNDPVNPVHTTAAVNLTFYGAANFYEPGSGLNSIDFGPTRTRGVVDTPQLGANAATTVTTATYAGPYTVSGSGATLASATLPAPAQDSIVICTLTFDGQWTSGLGLTTEVQCSSVQSGPTTGAFCDMTKYASTGSGAHFAAQWEFPLAAGVSPTVNVNVVATGGGAGTVQNVLLQCEVVKK